jgi:hypothetical protein
MSASLALQKAVFAALSADPGLAALIGPGRIFDDAPAGARPPYVLLGATDAADWSTGTETGEEIALRLEVWSPRAGRAEASRIASAIRAALSQPLVVEAPWRLVQIRHRATRTARDPATEYYRADIEFRAVVEPA